MKELYTPCYLCDDVVLEGSRRFDTLEPPDHLTDFHIHPSMYSCVDFLHSSDPSTHDPSVLRG